MNFNYCFKKWFQLISRPYDKYSHAVFFGGLVPEWNWDSLYYSWKITVVSNPVNFDVAKYILGEENEDF